MVVGKSRVHTVNSRNFLMDLYTCGVIYGRHFILVIIFIAPVNYTVNEKKYKHTVRIIYT